MTITAIDGFSSYSVAGSGIGGLDSNGQWASNNYTNVAFATPSIGGRGITLTGASTAVRLSKTFSARESMSCGFMCKITGLASAGTVSNLIYFGYANGAAITPTTQGQIRLQVLSSGAIAAIRNVSSAGTTTVLGTSATGVIQEGIEHFITVGLTIHGSAGVVNVYVDNVQVLNLTAQNTAALATRLVDTLSFSAAVSSSLTTTIAHFWMTDVVTIVAQGLRVETLVPASDGSHLDLTPSVSGAPHYTMVDELPQSSADYLQGDTAGQYDLLGLSDLASTPTAIYAVQAVGWMNKNDALARTAALGVKSGATQSDGSAITLSTTNSYYSRIMENDPNTGAAWTASAVNALELAPKIVS